MSEIDIFKLNSYEMDKLLWNVKKQISDKFIEKSKAESSEIEKKISELIKLLTEQKESVKIDKQIKLLETCEDILIRISYKMGLMKGCAVVGSEPNKDKSDNIEEMSFLDMMLKGTKEQLLKLGVELTDKID